jgi:hypothetical protein
MTRVFSLLACTALLVACQASDAPTAPSAVAPEAKSVIIRTRQRIPIIVDDIIENPCSGESIAMHFNELFVLQDLEIVGKAFHTHLVQMDRGTHGVGLTTGATYRQVGVQNSKAFFSAKVDEVQTFVLTGAVIGEGKAPDFHAHETFHLTVGPDGTARVEHDKFRFVCR